MKIKLNAHSLQEAEHEKRLKATGYWGAEAAGAIMVAKDTGKLLLLQRSSTVQLPHTWGGAGGALDVGEKPLQAVRRECLEELGYTGKVEYKKIATFVDGSFKYHNYFGFVSKEFEPKLNAEHEDFKWMFFSQHYPLQLHPGIDWLYAHRGPEMLGILDRNIENPLRLCHGHVRKHSIRARCGGPPQPDRPNRNCYMCSIEEEALERGLIKEIK